MWEGMVPAPTPGTLTLREAMYYTLSRGVSTHIIGCDSIAQLEESVNLARKLTPLSDPQAELESLAPSQSPSRRCSSAFTAARRESLLRPRICGPWVSLAAEKLVQAIRWESLQAAAVSLDQPAVASGSNSRM